MAYNQQPFQTDIVVQVSSQFCTQLQFVVNRLSSTSKNCRGRQIQSAQPAKVESSKPEPIRVKNNSKLSLSFGDICKATAAVFSSKGSQSGQKLFHFVFQALVHNRQLPRNKSLFVTSSSKVCYLFTSKQTISKYNFLSIAQGRMKWRNCRVVFYGMYP